MKTVAESTRMQTFPDHQFWNSILAPDAGHYPAACLCIDAIRHEMTDA